MTRCGEQLALVVGYDTDDFSADRAHYSTVAVCIYFKWHQVSGYLYFRYGWSRLMHLFIKKTDTLIPCNAFPFDLAGLLHKLIAGRNGAIRTVGELQSLLTGERERARCAALFIHKLNCLLWRWSEDNQVRQAGRHIKLYLLLSTFSRSSGLNKKCIRRY